MIVAPIIDDYIFEKVSCGSVMKGATDESAVKEGIQRFWVRIQGTSKFVNYGIKNFCWKGYISGILHHCSTFRNCCEGGEHGRHLTNIEVGSFTHSDLPSAFRPVRTFQPRKHTLFNFGPVSVSRTAILHAHGPMKSHHDQETEFSIFKSRKESKGCAESSGSPKETKKVLKSNSTSVGHRAQIYH
jgi:hypothetical protein